MRGSYLTENESPAVVLTYLGMSSSLLRMALLLLCLNQVNQVNVLKTAVCLRVYSKMLVQMGKKCFNKEKVHINCLYYCLYGLKNNIGLNVFI